MKWLILTLMLVCAPAWAQFLTYRAKPNGMGGPCADATFMKVISGQWDCIALTSLPPSGAAGGDLSGTYPNPTVAKVNGNAPTTAGVAHKFVSAIDSSARGTLTQPTCGDLSDAGAGCSGGAAAPTTASYITEVAEAGLSAEFALGSLGTGLLLNHTTTGVPTAYGGTSCTLPNLVRVLDASGAATCTEPSDSAGNSATSTALAVNGTNCSAASFPLGVDASGNAESCTTLASSNAGTATSLAANGTNCSAASFPLGVDASGNAESCTTLASSNTGTATALAANGTNCSAASFPLGVDASGNSESCTTLASSNAGTATALAADPTDCSSNQFANAIAASGNLTCAQINYNQLTGTDAPAISNVTGLGTGVGTFLATPSSANLISAVTDETGTGPLVFGTSPTLTTPALGTPSAIVLTNATGTASSLHVSATNADSGTLPAGQLPNPSASTLGGIESIAATAGSYVSSISTAGVPALTAVWQTWANFGSSVNPTCSVGGATNYIGASGGLNATEASVLRYMSPAAGTIVNMYVRLNANVPASETAVFTVSLNGGAGGSAVTCSIAAGALICNDTGHTQALVAGDIIAIKVVCSGGTSAVSNPVIVGLAIR